MRGGGGVSVGNHRFRIRELRGFGRSDMAADAATRHLGEVYASLTGSLPSVVSSNAHAYRTVVARAGGTPVERDVYLLDAQGGQLFPGLEESRRPASTMDDAARPTLRRRLDELGLADADVAVVVFSNEPSPSELGWRMHRHVPAALAHYLDDVPIRRVALHVACADVLFPRLGDLRHTLARINATALHPTGLAQYLDHFRGSPHAAFTVDILEHIGAAPAAAPVDVGVFWSSSFGALSGGQPNVALGRNPSVLADPADWTPLHALDPVLWASELLPTPSPEAAHAHP